MLKIDLQIDPALTQSRGHWWNINYYHFFTQKLTALWAVLEREKMTDRLDEVIVKYNGKYQSLLKALGPHVITECDAPADIVIPPEKVEPQSSMLMVPMAAKIAEGRESAPEFITILYRLGCRKMMDPKGLAEKLRVFGLPVRMETFVNKSIEYQIQVMKTSRVVISPHGAELTNIIFMAPGCGVIETMPWAFPSECFTIISGYAKLNHIQLEGTNIREGLDPEKHDEYVAMVKKRHVIRFKLRDVSEIEVSHERILEAVRGLIGTKVGFTTDWFSRNIPAWNVMLARFKGQPAAALEIGCWEGRATCWLLENILTHQASSITVVDNFKGGPEHSKDQVLLVENRFDANVEKWKHRVHKYSGESKNELAFLIVSRSQYEIIYVDGGHQSHIALTDIVMAWQLLKPGGVIIFDDYGWKHGDGPTDRPKIAIDAFLSCMAGQYEIIHQRYQVAVRKTATSI